MKRIILAAVAAVTLLGPIEADAGIVVIDGRELFFSGNDGYSSKLTTQSKKSNSSSTASTTSALASLAPTATPSDAPVSSDSKKATEDATTSDELSAYELEQIRQGLISEEEASSGCGGASAAAGPAGLLPLAITGLALLRRRRR